MYTWHRCQTYTRTHTQTSTLICAHVKTQTQGREGEEGLERRVEEDGGRVMACNTRGRVRAGVEGG